MTALTEFIAKLREKESAALEGPWHVFQWGDSSQAGTSFYNVGCDSAEVTVCKDIPESEAHFIAESRTAIPKLLSIIEEQARALNICASQTNDTAPPYRYMPYSLIQSVAKEAQRRVEELAGGA